MARLEAQPNDMVEEFRVDQHVEADRHLLLFARHDRAADLVAYAEDGEEEMRRHRNVRGYLKFGSLQRDRTDQAANTRLGA
ncbi:hypothetical protein D3C87_2126810 [compost metagenome]